MRDRDAGALTGAPVTWVNSTPTPVFLFSLPRSGSTLVQRILAAHEDIATASEPWVLIPYLYALQDRGVYAEYNHSSLVRAVEDFSATLPRGRKDYLAAVRELALRLYTQASAADSRYFLDKTPRYNLIAREVIETFPEARYIFLWRNPLSVVSSMIETWGGGRWNVYRHKVDLYGGLENLVDTYQRNRGRIHAVRYEDLILAPEETWAGVFRHLDLDFRPLLLESFGDVELRGRSGDPSGTRKYDRVSHEPLEGWKRTLNNPFRKAWCRRYLRWIGRERLALMGYDRDELVRDLDALPGPHGGVPSDVWRGCVGVVHDAVEPKILRRKLLELPAWRRVWAHK